MSKSTMNYYQDALAAGVRLKDVISSAENRALLHRINNNDPALASLFIDYSHEEDDEDVYTYQVREGGDLGWLGYFIGRNETLESLYVYYFPTCKDQMEKFFTGIKRNKSIKDIDFAADVLPSHFFFAINLPHVTTMSMGGNLDREKRHCFALGLRRCLSLESYYGPVTQEMAHALVALPMLENVSVHTIEDHAISRDESMALRTLLANATKMKQLQVRHAGLGNDGAELLAEGLACNVSLTDGVLDLSYNDIGDEGLKALASSLASKTKLKQLRLANNNIGDAGLEALADSLAHNRALRVLSIAGNTAITETGMRAISRVLQSRNSRLEDLQLDRIHISDEGGKILANALFINKTLVKLSLTCYGNGVSISDDGLRALSLGLSHNTTLQSLDLSSNTAITAAGLRSLKQYFRSPLCTLKNLTLDDINIGDDGVHALADALGRNKSLKCLYFGERGITFKGWEAFLKLLCDTSSPNSIYLSNHTLRHLGSWWPRHARPDVHINILRWLKINKNCETPKLAAKAKILNISPDLDMVPLFQWNLKPLPLVKSWFDRVTSSNDELAARIQRRKLSAVYQFVRGLPVLVVYDFRRYLTDQVQRIRARCQYHYDKISELEEEERRLMQV